MKPPRVYLAVDLGAGSGRVLAGIYDGSRLELREMHRFVSEPVRQDDGWHWNFPCILADIKKGISFALKTYGSAVVSLGVDTWGVDYGLIDFDGKLLKLPFQYRDKRTDGMMEEAFARVPKAEIYARTGIQFLFFNTLYQLLSERALPKDARLLFMPDLVNHALTGRAVNERTIASTSQLLNAKTGGWDAELLTRMDIPASLFPPLTDDGTDLGALLPEVAVEVGGNLRVIAVGSHDTASAVAGVPAQEEEPVFLSSGTWSLMGRELKQPVVTEDSFAAGFSNEGGVFGTTRFLKNISGMWLLQECKRQWDARGCKLGFGELVELAQANTGFQARIDPDAKEFQVPDDMPAAIAAQCRERKMPEPQTPGEFTYVILVSLAERYAEVKEQLEKATGQPVTKIHIVGGGSQNRFLNQLAANATGCEITSGPVEATSLGNILVQMIAAGELRDLKEGRELIARSFAVERFYPEKRA
jgi:sugar (pentulose or hexulose) kinase